MYMAAAYNSNDNRRVEVGVLPQTAAETHGWVCPSRVRVEGHGHATPQVSGDTRMPSLS